MTFPANFQFMMQPFAAINCLYIERMVETVGTTLQRTGKDFREIYERNVDAVYRVCFSFMKNQADAEDIAQETFLKLLDHEVDFASPAHERGWLIVTASNLCKNALRHWWRKNVDIDEVASLAANQDFETGEVLRAIMELPADYKCLVYMYYYEGYSGPEIAELSGQPKATVRSKLYRARKLLKNKLGGDYYG